MTDIYAQFPIVHIPSELNLSEATAEFHSAYKGITQNCKHVYNPSQYIYSYVYN
jgi:hypothetical protein